MLLRKLIAEVNNPSLTGKFYSGFHGWPFFLLFRAFCLWLLVRLRFSGFVLSKKPERGAAKMRSNGSDTVITGVAIKAPKARMAALFMAGLSLVRRQVAYRKHGSGLNICWFGIQ
jgi:hypothetical protein